MPTDQQPACLACLLATSTWFPSNPKCTLGCLMTLVAAVAQGLLMKPPDQSLPFKTWKLTDHWAWILGIQATLNLLCETISALKKTQNLTSHNLQMYTPHLILTLNNFLAIADSHINTLPLLNFM